MMTVGIWDQPITLEFKSDWQSNPSDLAALGHLPLHKGGFGFLQNLRSCLKALDNARFFDIICDTIQYALSRVAEGPAL